MNGLRRELSEGLLPIIAVLAGIFLLLGWAQLQAQYGDDHYRVIEIRLDNPLEEGELLQGLSPERDAGLDQIVAAIESGQWEVALGQLQPLLTAGRSGEALALRGLIAFKQGDATGALEWYARAAAAPVPFPSLPFYRGVALAQLERHGEAAEAFRAMLAHNPYHYEARLNLALMRTRQGAVNEALAEYRGLLETVAGTKKARVSYLLAKTLTESGAARAEEIEPLLEQAVRLQPAYLEPRLLLAEYLAERGDAPARVAGLIEAVEGLHPGDPGSLSRLAVLYLRQGERKTAIRRLNQALELDPSHQAARYNLGLAQLEQGRWQKARAAFARFLELEPDHARARFNLARAHYQLEQYPEALGEYQRALALAGGDYPEAQLNIALVQMAQKAYDPARAGLQALLAQDPGYAAAWYNLGLIEQRLARNPAALAAYQKVIALDPRHVESWYNLGVLYTDMGRVDEAIAAYRQALEIDPGHRYARLNLGVRLKHQGEREAAIAHYQTLLEQAPSYLSAWLNLAIAHLEADDFAATEAAVRRGLALEPDNGQLIRMLAKSLAGQGRIEAAAREYERALDLHPEDTKTRLSYARMLRRNGELEAAQREIQKALALAPQQENLNTEAERIRRALRREVKRT